MSAWTKYIDISLKNWKLNPDKDKTILILIALVILWLYVSLAALSPVVSSTGRYCTWSLFAGNTLLCRYPSKPLFSNHLVFSNRPETICRCILSLCYTIMLEVSTGWLFDSLPFHLVWSLCNVLGLYGVNILRYIFAYKSLIAAETIMVQSQTNYLTPQTLNS